jgi:hypothetical protein
MVDKPWCPSGLGDAKWGIELLWRPPSLLSWEDRRAKSPALSSNLWKASSSWLSNEANLTDLGAYRAVEVVSGPI